MRRSYASASGLCAGRDGAEIAFLTSWIPFASLGLLAVSWAYSVFIYGGVQAACWRWSVIGIAAASILLWLFPSDRKEARSGRLDFFLLSFVLLLGLVQILPASPALIQRLSPHRFNQLTAVFQVIGPSPSASLSSVPSATRDGLLLLAAYVLTYLVICDLGRRLRDHRWVVAAPVIAVAFLEASLGILQYYSGADLALGTYVNRNHFAGLLEMGLPFTMMLGFFMLTRNRDRFHTPAMPNIIACVFFGMAAVMLVSVINSQSRMGFISVLVSLLIMGVVGVSSHYSSAASPWRRWLPVIAVAGTIGLAFVFLPTDQLIGRFASMATTQEPSEDTRREIWRETVPLVRDYPLVGCGLYAYESCFLPYKVVAPGYTVNFAHDDYLQVMAEFGLPAFVLLLIMAALAYGSALRRTAVENPGRYLAIACVGSLTAILLHSFVDFNLYTPANAMLAVWVGGLAREA